MTPLDPIYIAARRVLLDTLTSLKIHLNSLVVIGAQAVYLHTGESDLAVAPYTTDTDIAVDPALLGTDPAIETLLLAGGFVRHHREPGIWLSGGIEQIPVDLIVPQTLSPQNTRRSAPLTGHGKDTLRKARGVEASVVDFVNMNISALDGTDTRSIEVKVAGVAALFIAKAHKIGEREERPTRLKDKDALDLYRLMSVHPVAGVSSMIIEVLLVDERSREITVEALHYLNTLFRAPASTGTQMAVRALDGIVPEARVAAVMNPYARRLAQIMESK